MDKNLAEVLVDENTAEWEEVAGDEACADGQEDPIKMELEENVIEHEGLYLRIQASELRPISNFTLQVLERIDGADRAELLVNFILQSGKSVQRRIPAEVFSSPDRLRRQLDRLGLEFSFQGSRQDLDSIKLLLAKQTFARRQFVDFVGLHRINESLMFVSQDGAVNASGNSCSEIVMSPDAVNVRTEILQCDILSKIEIETIVPALFAYNELPVTATVAAFAGICFLKPLLLEAGIKTGGLLMFGESGGGKSTTLEDVLQPIFAGREAMSASGITEASLRHALASSNTIPVVIEEFKPSKLDKYTIDLVYNELRSSYDGHSTQRGTRGGSVTKTALRAALVVVGEAAPNETAIRERCLAALFDKARLDRHPEYLAALGILQNHSGLLAKLGRTLLHVAMAQDVASLRDLHSQLMAEVPEAVKRWPQRIRQNYVSAELGIAMLESVCEYYGLSLAELTGKSEAEVQEALQAAIREYLLQGSDYNRTIVDETLAIMLSRMELKPGEDYRFLRGNEFTVNVNRCYDRFCSFVRQHHIDCETLPLDQFRQQLRNAPYHKESRTERLGGSSVRVPIFDAEKLRACIGDAMPLRPILSAA